MPDPIVDDDEKDSDAAQDRSPAEATGVELGIEPEGTNSPSGIRMTPIDDVESPTTVVASDDEARTTQAAENALADLPAEVEQGTETNSASEGADIPAFSPNLLRQQRLRRFQQSASNVLVRYKWTTTACAMSMLVGFLLSLAWVPSGLPEAGQVAAMEQPLKFVATVRRRHEPIKPVIPFDDLDPNVVEVGKRLFHDSSLSGSGKYSCAGCHKVELPRPKLERPVDETLTTDRDAPPIINAALNFGLGWDAKGDDLESYLDSHFSQNGVMRSDWERVMLVVREDPLYFRSFQLYFQAEPSHKLVREALATYQRSLLYVDSPFDRWLQGDESAINSDVIAGYYLFKQMNCIACHQGAGVGGTMVRPLGALIHSLSPAAANDFGLFEHSGRERDKYVFRVPSLRNASLTAPYFHDGSAETLEQAVELMMRHESEIADPNPVDVRRLTAFIGSLTGRPLDVFLREREAAQQAVKTARADDESTTASELIRHQPSIARGESPIPGCIPSASFGTTRS